MMGTSVLSSFLVTNDRKINSICPNQIGNLMGDVIIELK